MFNNTRFAERELLFFNRIPKVGSEQLIELINRLAFINQFGVSRAKFSEPVRARLDEEAQEELANDLIDLGEPYAYTMHVNFIDFTKFDLPRPIYINMIRDPVERIISWFYYIRTPWNAVQMYKLSKQFRQPQWYKKDFEKCVLSKDTECVYMPGSGFKNELPNHKRQTLFFCGHDRQCEPFNSRAAVQLAKHNVERNYAVVGSFDDLNVTLRVLERYVPRFFTGAFELYYDKDDGIAHEKQNSNPWKPKISEHIKEIIRKNFTKEYEFYNFCKQRLYKQFFAMTN